MSLLSLTKNKTRKTKLLKDYRVKFYTKKIFKLKNPRSWNYKPRKFKLRLSNSGINLFLQCPYAWFLKYVLQRKGFSTVYMILGTAYHEVIEGFYLNKKISFSKIVKEELLKHPYLIKDKKIIKAELDRYKKVVKFYKENIMPNYILKKPEDVEQEILLNIKQNDDDDDEEGINLIGYIDLLLTNIKTGREVVVDIKTTGQFPNESDFNFDYFKQLSIYKQVYPQRDIELHYLVKYFKTCVVQEYKFDKKHVIFNYENIRTIAFAIKNAVDNNSFPATGCFVQSKYTKNIECYGCLYRQHCKYFKRILKYN